MLADFLPRRIFDRIVKNHQGNKCVRSFTCWNQMLYMVFGQLTAGGCMRDLMLSISLLNKASAKEMLTKCNYKNVKERFDI
jgi:hypothetical protein